MTAAEKTKLVKLLKKLKGSIEQKSGVRSTVVDCSDFLLAVMGEKKHD